MIGNYLNGILKHLVFTVVFTALCFSGNFKAEGAEVVDRIVAVVNDDIISLFELNQSLKPYTEKIRALGYTSEKERKMLFKVREDILNQLIDQKLTDQEIKRFRIAISEKEIDSAIERIKEVNFYTDEELKEALAREGLTIEKYRKRMKEQMLRTKLVNLEIKSKIVITKEDIKSYYESHADEYGGENKYHLRNIIMKVFSAANEAEKLAVYKKMESILAKLKDGESFEAMAAAYSESSLASEGGDLGLFGLDDLSPQLQEAIRGLNAGEFTSVLDTDQGYQIFFVQDIIKTQGRSLEEVSPEIEEKLFNEIVDEKFRSWLEGLRKRSCIKIVK